MFWVIYPFLLDQFGFIVQLMNEPFYKFQVQAFQNQNYKYQLFCNMQNEEIKSKTPSYQQYLIRFEKQTSLRKQNFQKEEQDIGFMLPSNKTAAIKTIQKFISKFKMQNKNQQSILQQMDSLNLSKYTEEIANIIVNSLTEKDIQFYTEVSTKLNKQYTGFPAIIIQYLKKLFTTLFESPEDNKSRLKAVLIFTTELFVCGFTFSYKQVRQMLIKIFKSGNKKKNNIDNEAEKKLFAFYYNSECFVQFLINYWEQFTRFTPKWITDWKQKGFSVKQFPPSVPLTQKDELTKFFTKYIFECENVLIENIEVLKKYQNQLRQNLRMEGEFNKESEKRYTHIINNFTITKENLYIICQAANEPFNEQKLHHKINELSELMKAYVNTNGDAQIFQNEFEKEIYQNLPQFTKQQKNSNESDYKQFKQSLQICRNVSDADSLAKEFEMYNNKKNRKQLVKDILQYRKEYYLVTPYLCRLAAIVNQSWKDIGEMVNQTLFNQYEKMKENSATAFIVTDKKNRNWKYLCEFTKLKIIDPERIIICLHNLIEDLKGHNVQLLIFGLQNVGRFLFLTSKTANKFTFLLNKLENVVKQKSFPLLTTSRLINIMTLIKPVADQEPKAQRVLTEEEKQAVQILSNDITGDLKDTLSKVRKFLEKGPKQLQHFNRVMVDKILQYNFIGNYHYAYLLYQLDNKKVTEFVLQRTMKIMFDSIKSYQYQSSMILSRFIGELFKYELLKKSTLYNTLEDLFLIEGNELGVINSVCTVLQTCVGYLDSKKILSQNNKFRFLFSFKKYLKKCKYIPMMEEFRVTDVFEAYQEKCLCTLGIEYVQDFMHTYDEKKDKQGKQVNLSKEFDKYIERKNLKEKKSQIQDKQENDDRKKQNQKFIDEDEEMDKKSSLELLKNEAKIFQNQFNVTLNSNIKDFSSRIAKQAFLQKTVEKKKEKKKTENEKVITVIGRSGTRFIKKDVAMKQGQGKNKQEKKTQIKKESEAKI